jgi:hypothetical protein
MKIEKNKREKLVKREVISLRTRRKQRPPSYRTRDQNPAVTISAVIEPYYAVISVLQLEKVRV